MSNLTPEQRELLIRQRYSRRNTNSNSSEYVRKEEGAAFGFLRLRLTLAFFFFFSVFVLDKTNASIAGITAEEIRAIICVDYEQSLDNRIAEWNSYKSPSK